MLLTLETKNESQLLHRAHLIGSKYIPEGAELEIGSIEGLGQTIYQIKVLFPLKKSKRLQRPDNCFGVSYKADTLDLPDEQIKKIVTNLVREEDERRRLLNRKFWQIRKSQWLYYDNSTRVDGEKPVNYKKF